MFTFKLLFLVIIVLVPQDGLSKISDKRLCADEKCAERISLARTVLRYNSPEKGLLSVPQNKEVFIYSKSAGSNTDLWGVEYNGKRGYLNKKFLRETRVFKWDLPFLVDTELAELEKVPSSDTPEDILPNQQTEVIDGTTITLNPSNINPSATEDNVKPTESVLNAVLEDSENEDDGDENEEDDEDEEEENISVEGAEIDSIEKGEINGTVDLETENNEGKNVNTEENLITKESITSRSLLQHDEKIVDLKNEINKNSENVIDNTESEKISLNDKTEEMVVTTESTLDAPFNDDFAQIETITENPGQFEDDSENFLGFGLGDIKKEFDAMFEDEGIGSEENSSEKNGSEENNFQVPQEKGDNTEENVPSESIQIEKVEENISNEDVVKTEIPETLKEINENIQNSVEDDQKKENVPLESDQIEKVEENVKIIDVPSEPDIQIEKVDENVDIVKTVSSENPSQIEPIDSINTDFYLQNTIQKDDITNTNTSEESDVKMPTISEINSENTIIPETPKIDNNDNLDLTQTNSESVPKSENYHSINSIPESLSETASENLFENASENLFDNASENLFENASENLSENASENSSENLELDSGNKEPDSGGWYNSFFGGTTENVDENVVEKPVIQDNIEDINNEEYSKPEVQKENVDSVENMEEHEHNIWTDPFHSQSEDKNNNAGSSVEAIDSCSANADDCSNFLGTIQNQLEMDFSSINFSDVLNLVTVLGITGITVVIFLLGYIAIDKSRRETPLVAKINKLEKALLVSTKENQILTEQVAESENEFKEQDVVTSKIYTELEECNRQLMDAKTILEEQVQSLEKELENSTEVGFELNRMLSEILKSQSGSDMLVANIENLQRQLVEQQSTINSINATLNLKDTENHELQLELEIKNKKVIDLQAELDKMALNLMKIEEEKDQIQSKFEQEIQTMKEELNKIKISFGGNKNKLTEEINGYKKRLGELQKAFDLKSSEYNILKENFNQIKSVKNNNEVMKNLLQSVTSKAELSELQKENNNLNELLVQERQIKVSLEERAEDVLKEMRVFKEKYDEVDKEKLEAQTKLEVLGNYFKEREAELQRELAKQEALWQEKQGEATSSTERIRYIKEELQNFKSQNELLKQEIVSQEVELKSQISVLEKKAHESWLSARQAERRLEDAKQEAAQLRNRLTLKERSFIEDKGQHRVQSPLEQNGEIIESPASPTLLYSAPHDHHLTTSPGPLPPGLPPFLPPPPPGVPPFMPPPPGVPGFMPPPPSMFPVDHRPPPLGRMSSPPLNSRYSPDSSRYSDRYDDRNNSPSPPPYDEDDRYGPVSPPPRHGRPYSPYRNDRREYKRPNAGGGRTNGRNNKGASSGSENSNSETIDRTSRHHTKI